MMAWRKAISLRESKFFRDEEGATATEYAVLIAAILLVIAATIYYMADFEGNGVAQTAFKLVGNQAGQFGKVPQP